MYCFKEEFSSCIFAIILVKALKVILIEMPLVMKKRQKIDNEHNFDFIIDAWISTVCCSLGKFKFLIISNEDEKNYPVSYLHHLRNLVEKYPY